MASPLDFEEQEQLDQIKYFWKKYGSVITWSLIVVLGAFASWNFYQYWQRNQATQAAVMYDEVDRAVMAADTARIDRVFTDMKTKFSSTTYAQQAGLLVAKQYYEAGQVEAAKAALSWVADKSSDPGYQAIAKLRLAGILAGTKAFEEALLQLSGSFPSHFEALVADRKGDILMLQDKKAEAIVAYEKAYQSFDSRTDYRRLVEVKLNALGVNPIAENSVETGTKPAVQISVSDGQK